MVGDLDCYSEGLYAGPGLQQADLLASAHPVRRQDSVFRSNQKSPAVLSVSKTEI